MEWMKGWWTDPGLTEVVLFSITVSVRVNEELYDGRLGQISARNSIWNRYNIDWISHKWSY